MYLREVRRISEGYVVFFIFIVFFMLVFEILFLFNVRFGNLIFFYIRLGLLRGWWGGLVLEKKIGWVF